MHIYEFNREGVVVVVVASSRNDYQIIKIIKFQKKRKE